MTEFKYLGQTTHRKDTTTEKNICQNQSSVELFWKKNKEILQLSISLKKQVMD